MNDFLSDMREVSPDLYDWAKEQAEQGATLAELQDRIRRAMAHVERGDQRA